MKAFVTGGTGFIGSHLVDALLSDEANEVRCLIRSSEKWLTGKNVERINGDMHDLVALKNGLEGVDVVFHLAALVKAPKKEILYKTNVEATENLIRMAQKSGVRKMVILSSLAAVGPSFKRPVNEQDPLMPVSMYGESKKKMEEMIHSITQPENSITILRPPAVYGPREEQIYSFFKICAKGFCPIIGSGDKTYISMVHVADVVHGLLLASQQTEKGVHTYFVSSEEVYNWNQIRKATSIALDRRLLPIYIKPNIVKGMGTMLESVGSLFGMYPVMNKDKALEMTHEWTCSVDAIKKDLGYSQQIPLEEGIFHTISWYKKHNWI